MKPTIVDFVPAAAAAATLWDARIKAVMKTFNKRHALAKTNPAYDGAWWAMRRAKVRGRLNQWRNQAVSGAMDAANATGESIQATKAYKAAHDAWLTAVAAENDAQVDLSIETPKAPENWPAPDGDVLAALQSSCENYMPPADFWTDPLTGKVWATIKSA